MPGESGLSGESGMTEGGGITGVNGLSGMNRNALRGRLDASMPIAWIIGPAAHLFHAAMKLFEPLGF